MRLFIALDLSDATRAALARLASHVGADLARLAPAARVTWVKPDRMHLTLRFFGSASDVDLERLLGVLGDPIAAAPFEVTWGGLGVFPPRGTPRVIWVGVASGEGALEGFADALDERLSVAGVPRESRPFSPHLTLGRVREGARWAWPPLAYDVPVGRDRIGHVTLYESRLSPGGPTYTPITRAALDTTARA